MSLYKKPCSIVNKSDWPGSFVKLVVPWILKRAGISWNYTVYLKKHKHDFSGNGSSYRQISRIDRRMKYETWPWTRSDHRYKWSKEFTFCNRVEVFVFLIAHEAYHAVLFRNNKNSKNSFDESRCNDFGYQTVIAYRAEKKEPLKVLAGLREERRKRLEANKKLLFKKSTEYKINVVQQHLKSWMTKKKRAETMIKNYQKKINYYTKKIIIIPEPAVSFVTNKQEEKKEN